MVARPSTSSSAAPRVHREQVDGTVVLSVSGALDDAVGRELVAALQATLADGPDRVDIDLAEVDDFTAGGAAALGECRSYTDHLAEGLHYRTVQGPGQDAFLAAFE